ncbi:MAG: SCP2 sterol-binding domain-containing protein [Myxococcota bacterium]
MAKDPSKRKSKLMSTNDHAVPPDDISPLDFFSRWVPEMVARDQRRQKKLGNTQARIVFVFDEPEYGAYTIYVNSGEVRGEAGRVADPDLEIQIGFETWRSLNRGEISAPEAALRRRLKLTGDTVLALKLHLILG